MGKLIVELKHADGEVLKRFGISDKQYATEDVAVELTELLEAYHNIETLEDNMEDYGTD